MNREKLSCPSCGMVHELPQPLPESITCGNCRTVFSPVDELRRYSIHICIPGKRDRFAESHYSGRPFMIPRPGDIIVTRYLDPSGEKQLRVSGLEFEFPEQGETARQVLYVLTETLDS